MHCVLYNFVEYELHFAEALCGNSAPDWVLCFHLDSSRFDCKAIRVLGNLFKLSAHVR